MQEKIDKKFEGRALVNASIMHIFFILYLYAFVDYYYNIYPIIYNKGIIMFTYAVLTLYCIMNGNFNYSIYKIKILNPKQYYECGGRIG